MKVNVYLNFDGQTEEAFSFYKSVFGGEMTPIQRFKDVPPGGQPMPEGEGDRVMHVGLQITPHTMLMGTDISPGMGHKLNVGNNVYISLNPESKDEADRLFKKLSDGGKIEMPMQKMFWGDYYGSFTDKFGVQWMINFHEEEKK